MEEEGNRNKTIVTVVILAVIAIIVMWLFIGRGEDKVDEATTPPEIEQPAPIDTGVPGTDDATTGSVDDGVDDGAVDDTTDPGDTGDTGTDDGSDTSDGADEVVTLPDNWDDMTLAEKIALNPYGCDLEKEYMWPDATCHPKSGTDNDDDSTADTDTGTNADEDSSEDDS